jgi:bifunctional non-homologous end joining protein LigD
VTSLYRSGRSKTWLKSKCFIESHFVLVGVDKDRKTGAPRALLATASSGRLEYAGAAFITLGAEAREALSAKLDEMAQERPSITWLKNRNARWVRPDLGVKVKHLAGTRLLRQVREMVP